LEMVRKFIETNNIDAISDNMRFIVEQYFARPQVEAAAKGVGAPLSLSPSSPGPSRSVHLLPRLHRSSEPPHLAQRSRADSCPMVKPSEIRGSQLIGLSRVTRQRGQWHSTWVKPSAANSLRVA
jgi:hypothetical protein